MLKTVSSITNAIGALNYKGTWNASTNTPALASGVGTKGDYYVVSVAGTTALDGISNWGVGDWVTFNGSVWQRVEGGADLNGVNLSVSGTTTLSGLTASTALALDASKNVASVTNTGTGNNVLADGPTLTTPTLGVASATSINKVALTAPATGSTLTIADGKTLTANHSLTLAGTDATTMTFPNTSATIARTDAAQTFTGDQTFSGSIISTKVGVQESFTTYGNRFEITDTRSAITVTPTAFLKFAFGNGKASAIIRVVCAGSIAGDDEIACTRVWLATRREGAGTSFTITNVESQGINTGAITLTENGRDLDLSYVRPSGGTNLTAWTYVEFIGISMLSGTVNPITATVL